MNLRFIALILLFLQQGIYAQEINFSAATIPDNLKENANALVRFEKITIDLQSQRSMLTKQTRIVTVFNENGNNNVDASEVFDKSTSVKSIEAVVYNAAGAQIKKIKRKDFKETALSEGSIITDNRAIYLEYTPVEYPYTIVFTCETETSNTAFIPQWRVTEGAGVSIGKKEFSITSSPGLGFRYKEYNFEGTGIQKSNNGNTLAYTAENIAAARSEDYSPVWDKVKPYVIFGIEKFHLEGVDATVASWEDFGDWYYNNLLTGTDELSPETINKIKGVVGTETDPVKKAKLVYEYMQSKTRYISIQLGIGGWKPMLAKDVDRLGYGDCKALSNYTRALLKAVGVESYCVVIYGDSGKRDLREDFVSMQGNHMILAVPDKDKMIWLECTSQVAPFGFQGRFTDDRMALVVKPKGSQLVRTGIYETQANLQSSKGTYKILDSGAIAADFTILSKGTQYDNKYYLESESKDNRDKYYKSGFSNINNLKLKKTDIKNNKNVQELLEDIALEAEGYCNKSGNKLIFSVNAFNQYSAIPQRYRSRKMPFEVLRGFVDTDEITIVLPEGFTMESKPEDVTIKDKYGEYTAQFIPSGNGSLLYKRSLTINQGYYASTDYENYRLFREKIARNDNAKVVLVKN